MNAPAWYRVRLQSGRWYVFLYDARMNVLDGKGPFASQGEANNAAPAGVADLDKA